MGKMRDVEWIPIKGFEEKYLISNTGEVYSFYLRDNLKVQKNKYGYAYCQLSISKNNLKYSLIHRLVALHFLPNPEDKPQVNHIDGNKGNNTLENLEWATAKENTKHAYEKKLRNNEILRNNGIRNSKKVYQIDIDTKNIVKVWNSAREARRVGGFHDGHIANCCKLETESYNGFIWRYEENKNENLHVTLYKIHAYRNDKLEFTFDSIREAAEKFGVTTGYISNHVNGRSKSVKGYVLKREYYEH